jgi:hypothetical protein
MASVSVPLAWPGPGSFGLAVMLILGEVGAQRGAWRELMGFAVGIG